MRLKSHILFSNLILLFGILSILSCLIFGSLLVDAQCTTLTSTRLQPCLNGGSCDSGTGICDCSNTGTFQGDYCQNVLCSTNGTASISNTTSTCTCHATDFGGPACERCRTNDACVTIGSEGKEICDKSFLITDRKFIECSVHEDYFPLFMSRAATFQCNKLEWEQKAEDNPTGTCSLQAWTDSTFNELVISCGMERCTHLGRRRGEAALKFPADKYVGISCLDIHCSCVKPVGCGTPNMFFKDLNSGGSIHCNNGTNECVLEQPDMRVEMRLPQCGAGECVSQLASMPDFPESSIAPIIYGSIGGFLLLCLIATVTICCCLGVIFDVVHSKRSKTEWMLLRDRVHGLNITVQNVSLTKMFSKGKILDDVSCEIPAGELVAIMGASGAGKTSLLDIIAGRKKNAKLQGRILYDGVSINKLSQRHVGYVFQDDLMFTSLTVRETLNFIADLRLPPCVSQREKKLLVQEVLNSLKIAHVAKNAVSRISGGERRRLALGVELLALPPCLALDEITSGLDSQTAQLCCKLLQRLCREKGRTIVCSIHQPRSDIWRMFDRVILLSKGRLIYSGPRVDAVTYFESLGFFIPPETNPADFIIDCLVALEEKERVEKEIAADDGSIELQVQETLRTSSPSEIGQAPSETAEHVDEKVSVEAYDNEAIENGVVADHATSTEPVSFSSEDAPLDKQDINGHAPAPALSVNTRTFTGTSPLDKSPDTPYFYKSKYSVSFLRQTIALSNRAFKNFRRNFALLPLQFGSAIFIGILVGLIFFGLGYDIAGSQSRSGVLFFSLFILAFSSMSNLDIFIRERRIFTREVASGWYHPASYFIAKALFDIIPLRILPPILMGSIFYWMCDLNNGAGQFFWFLFILVLFNICSGAMGLMVGIASPSVGIANFISILLILGNSLFAGFLINRRSLKVWIGWLSWLSYWSYAFEALITNEFIGHTLRLAPQALDLTIDVGGSFWLDEFGMDQDRFYIDIVAVGAFAVFFLLVSGGLLMFVRERR